MKDGFEVTGITVTEGASITFTVRLHGTLAKPATVEFTTIDQTAISGVHYTHVTGNLLFGPGESLKTITVPTIANATELCAPDRTLSLKLSNPNGATITVESATATITDPDVPDLSIDSVAVSEGGIASFTASLSAACVGKTVSFNWSTASGTAIQGGDFNGVSAIGTISPGALSTVLPVSTINDAMYETAENFSVTISAPSNATISVANGTGTITDNDSVPTTQFALASQSINELGGTASVTVSLSNPSYQDVTIPFALSGSASVGSGNDYTITASPVTISAGTVSTIITVVIADDLLSEANETIVATIGAPVNAVKGTTDTHTITIVDNDVPKIANVTSSSGDGTYTSGNIDISILFTGNVDVVGTPLLNLNTTPSRTASYLSGTGTNTLTFRYAIQYSDQSSDLDYSSTSALVLSGGTIKDALKNTNADLTLFTPGTAGSLGSNKNIVINAPSPPYITSVTIPSDGNYYENDSLDFTFNFSQTVVVTGTPTLSLSIGGTPVTASYISGSGSAALVFRYTIGSTVFADGPVLTSPLNLSGGSIKNSVPLDAVLTFTVPDLTGVIVDGRSITMNFSIPQIMLSEASGTAQTFTVSLSEAPLTATTIPLFISGNATSGSDYSVPAASVSFPAGQTTVTIPYDVLDDSVDELAESFTVMARNSSTRTNVVLGTSFASKVNIIDDDPLKERWSAIAAGMVHSCGITTTGVLKCWGDNAFKELGDGTTTNRPSPVVINSGTSYKSVAVGGLHTCGVTTSNVLKCWGSNSSYQLGDGTTTSRATPTTIDGGTTYNMVAARGSTTCAITTTGNLKCWGDNYQGKVGNGSTSDVSTPVTVLTNVKTVSVGSEHTCAVDLSNAVYCWGGNGDGQLGRMGIGGYDALPGIVDSGSSYSDVSAGGYVTCGLMSSGTLKCWGDNSSYQFGDGTSTSSGAPVAIDTGTVYKAVSVGEYRTCGITTGNVLRCWGRGQYGALGTGNTTNQPLPVIIDSGVSYKAVATGDDHTCGIDSSDILKCWGSGSKGQLGDGLDDSKPAFIYSSLVFSTISSGADSVCGLSSGQLYCWGKNQSGQLGDGTLTSRSIPQLIDSGTVYSSVSVGNLNSCAITTSGKLKCWGDNSVTQLGSGVPSPSKTPLIIDQANNYKSVSVGYNIICGIRANDDLYCWGLNTYGQIGNGTTVNATSPTQVDPGVTYKQISTGGSHVCGITSTNVLKCWGNNTLRQLGDGTTVDKHAPVVIDSGVSYKFIRAGGLNTCGITTSDVLKCWGMNFAGALGDGTTVNKASPVVIKAGTSFSSVANSVANTSNTCATTTGNILYCWGNNVLSPAVYDSGISYSSVAAGNGWNCGLMTTGNVRCWGDNSNGVLGTRYGQSFPMPVGSF